MRGIPKWMVVSGLLAGIAAGGAERGAAEAPAQIAGRVIDAETGEPAADAPAEITGPMIDGVTGQPAAGRVAPGQICGAVTDRESGQPVPGGLVGLEREGARTRKAVTGRDGSFCLDDVAPGGLRLTVSLMGYDSHVEEITLAPGAALDLEIALRSDPIQLAPVEILGEPPLVSRKRTGTVSKLPPRTVELIKPVGTQELLELLPGINGYADDGFGNSRLSIGIRGLNPRRSSRVLILEDGVPIQPAVYVYPNAYYNPPSERIDAMEVVKGSSAVRFGPQTMGGVINYTTRRPDGTRGMVNQVAAGGNGYYSLYSEWRGLGGGRTASDAQLLYKHGNGFRDNNTFDQLNGTVKTQVRLSGRKVLYLKLNGNLEKSKATYTGLTEYSFRTDPAFNPKEDDVFDVRRASLDLMYTSRITPDLTGNTTLYLNAFDRRWWREDDIFVRASALETGDLTPVPYYQGGDLVRVGGGAGNFGILRTFYVGGAAQDYTLRHTLAGGAARAEAGVRAHWERFVDDRKIGGAPGAREGVYYTGTPGDPGDPVKVVGQSHHYETAALALYARERVEWGPWTLSPGARFEIFEQERVDRLRGAILADKLSWVLLPGLGVNYQRGPVNLFAGVHRGYTPPSSGALKLTNFGQDAGAGGLDLKPEKSWNLEAGLRSRGPALTLEACAFLLRVEDLVAAGRGTAFRNLGEVETYGLETALALHASGLGPVLPDLHLAHTWLQTRVRNGRVTSATRAGDVEVDISGNELPYAPPHTLTVSLVKETRGLRLRTDVRFVDDVFTDFENIDRTFNRGDTGPIPAYSIVNASADYAFAPRWSAFVTAKNLLDEVYIGSRLHSNAGQPQAHLSSGILVGPRRQLTAGIRRGL